MTFRVVIGCDPGQSGALALLADGQPAGFIDMPTMARAAGGNEVNAAELAASLRGVMHSHRGAYIIAIVEAVSAMPGNGASSMFRFGESFGVLKGVLGALSIPYQLVHPQTWKRKLTLIGSDKDAARTMAIRLFPQIAMDLARKKDIGRADALLVARYGELIEVVGPSEESRRAG
jgi:crossover junction endodeoxyribonuclease RuvC